ncbi:UNVERIFIED_ORG: hypothetical protein EDC92_12028 [Dietzia maris]|uniref:hypothetical protein n=1 Tax=Dietzia maris TaxID=37915 RepID=UPI001045767F
MSNYTYDDVCTAANGAANMLDDLGLDADTTTLIDFVVNATLTLLEHKNAGVEDVLEENWSDSEARETIRDIVVG